MKEFKQHLINESGLSRLWQHNEEHDCGALTAYRTARNCGEGEPYSSKENKQRNKSLLAKIKANGYGATTLRGKYPEGGKSVTEVSYFVVDLQDKGNLEKTIKALGKEFEQDSILFIPKGAIKIKGINASLIGTNKCDNNWIGYGQSQPFERGRLGIDSPIYTSYVNGRPFIFEEVGKEVISPANGMGVWAMHLIAKQNWEDIDI